MKKILIIILSLLVMFGATFSIYKLFIEEDDVVNKNDNDKKDRDETKNENKKKEDLTTEEIDTLLDRIVDYWVVFQLVENIEDYQDASEEVLTFFLIYSSGINDDGTFNKKELDDAFAHLFGKNHGYSLSNRIKCPLCDQEPLFIYNEDLGVYETNDNHLGHGLEWSNATLSRAFYENGYKTDNEYVIEAKLLYAGLYGGWYANGDDMKPITYDDVTDNDIYKDFKDELDTVRFTFELEDNLFILKDVNNLN